MVGERFDWLEREGERETERERKGGREGGREGGRGRDFQVPNLEFSLEAKRKSLLETPSLLLRGRRGTQHVHVYPVPSWKKLDGSPLPAWIVYIVYFRLGWFLPSMVLRHHS